MGEQLAPSKPAAESPSYTRLTRADHRTIMHLHDEGLTLSAIAKRLSRSVSTIHEVVDIYAPTDDLAKRKLRASSLRMANNVIENGKPSDHVAALKGLSVLEEDRSSGLVIQIGVKDSDVSITLSPPSNTGSERKVQETLAIQAGSDKAGYVNP